MTDLKPCPFCGGEAVAMHIANFNWHSVMCDSCMAETMDYGTDEEAVAAWNTRAADDATQHTHCCPCGAERTCTPIDRFAVGVLDCDKCGLTLAFPDDSLPKYCPNCGARVVGE